MRATSFGARIQHSDADATPIASEQSIDPAMMREPSALPAAVSIAWSSNSVLDSAELLRASA